ncbi:diacylglycerol kinase [Candidatus Kaiserbacteria bacterium]|nr:diacylglycerol kinase [Candidatus Kaiserbacteria bacterium]
MKKYFNRFPHAVRGITYATGNDFGFRTQVYLGLVVAFIVFAIYSPLSLFEFLFILLGWFLILITELQNSALEIALDQLHPELHDSIGRSKDMAAGAVLLAGLFLTIVLIALLLSRLI